VVVDFNIGAGSSVKNRKGLGAYLGGGYAYSYTTFTNSSSQTVRSYDPLVRGGIRFSVGKQQLFTVGFSYKWIRQYGVQVLKDL
jgi:hypothetical protein